MSAPVNQANVVNSRSNTLWNQAYARLNVEKPELTQKYEALASKEFLHGAPCVPSDGKQIASIIKKGQERVDEERLRIGRINIPDALDKVATVVSWAKDWIDAAVQVSPEASLAWSIASMALPLIMRPAAAENDCTNGFIYITDRMAYYNSLEDVLMQLDEYFRDELIPFYRLILEYHIRTVLRVFRNSFKKWGRDLTQQDDWQGLLTAIKYTESGLQQKSIQNASTKTQKHLVELARAADNRYSKLEQLVVLSKESIVISQHIRDSLAQQVPLSEETLSVLKDISDKLTLGPISQPQPSFMPKKMISVNRDECFIRREVLMDSLHRKCSRSASTTALIGLGGSGKTQLAIEYAHQTFDQAKSVFWVYSGTFARFEQGFRILARKLGFSNWDNPKVNIFSLVQGWLENEENGPWFLVMDNLDDASFLDDIPYESDISTQPLKSYLPTVDHGAILITTRSKQAARYLVEDRDFLFVEPMTEAEAVALFRSKVPDLKNDADCVNLVRELDFLPLAIVHAAAYIARRGWHVRKYLELFGKSDVQKSKLLSGEKNDLRRDRESQATILTTWQITFDHIKEIHPSAAYLLSIMSLFDRSSISQQIFLSTPVEDSRTGTEQKDKNEEFDMWREIYSDDETALEDDVLVLREYLLVTLQADEQCLQMHRLVQLGMHMWLRKNDRFDAVNRSFIQILSGSFPGIHETNGLSSFQKILPHFRTAESRTLHDRASQLDWASVLFIAANCKAHIQGDFGGGAQLFEKSASIRLELLGEKNILTLQSQAESAICDIGSGKFDTGETLLRKVLKLQTELLGPEHPDTLRSIRDLGICMNLTMKEQDNLGDIEVLWTTALEGFQKKLGADHPHTIKTLELLASLRVTQRRLHDAEIMLKQVVEVSERAMGKTNVRTMTRQLDLLEFYREELEKPDIEETIRIVNFLRESIGGESAFSLLAKGELALAYRDTEQPDEAIKIFNEIKSVSRQVSGESSITYFEAIGYLIEIYIDMEQPMPIEKLVPDIVRLQKTYEEDHNQLIQIASLLLFLAYYGMNLWTEAEQEADKVLNPDSGFTVTSSRCDAKDLLVVVYWKQGKRIEAGILAKESTEERIVLKGITHPDVIDSLTRLAVLHFALGDYTQAEEHATKALDLWTKVDKKHINKIATMVILASTDYRLGKDKEARSLDRKGLEMIIKLHTEKAFTSWYNILKKLSRPFRKLDLMEEAGELESRFLSVWQDKLEENTNEALTFAESVIQRSKERNQLETADLFESKVLIARKNLPSKRETNDSTVESLTDVKQPLEELS